MMTTLSSIYNHDLTCVTGHCSRLVQAKTTLQEIIRRHSTSAATLVQLAMDGAHMGISSDV